MRHFTVERADRKQAAPNLAVGSKAGLFDKTVVRHHRAQVVGYGCVARDKRGTLVDVCAGRGRHAAVRVDD